MPFDNKDEFIAAKGVTRCPPAFAAHSEQAKPLSVADRLALREHAKIFLGVESAFGGRKAKAPAP